MQDEIRQAVYRVSAAIDRGCYDWLGEIFREDAVIVAGPFEGSVADFVKLLEARRAAVPRASHMIGAVHITPLGEDRAFVESYCLTAEQTAPTDGPAMHRVANMRYVDQFERGDAGWRIVRRTTIVDVSHPPVPLAEGLTYRGPQGRRDSEDPALLLLAAAREAQA